MDGQPLTAGNHLDLPDQEKGSLTISRLPTRCCPFGHLPLLLQINVPTIRLPLFVLERKCEDGVAFLYGVFPLRVIGL